MPAITSTETSTVPTAPDTHETWEHPKCDLCGSERRRLVYRLADWRYGRPDPEYSVYQCRDCGLGYLFPRPTAGAMHVHYPAEYDDRRRGDDPEIRRRYEAQARWVKDCGAERGGRLLDVGAASGEFVSIMREAGWDATGIDPFARQDSENVLAIGIDSERLPTNSFDVVTAWHVLEHLHSPLNVLRRVRELLKPGGVFCFSVPNFDSYRARWLMGEDIPRHLHFFCPTTLRQYSEKCGFESGDASFDADFASGALGRCAFTRYVYCWLGGLSVYEHHRIMSDPSRSFAEELPFVHQLARPVRWLERWILTPQRLEASRKMGVVAMRLRKPQ